VTAVRRVPRSDAEEESADCLAGVASRGRYDERFRRAAAALVVSRREWRERRNFSSVAEELGINPSTVRSWVVRSAPQPDPGSEQEASAPERRTPGRVLTVVAVDARCDALLLPARDGTASSRCGACVGPR
jgi:hypothetical protein